MGKNTSSEFLGVKMEDIKIPTSVVGTQRRPFRGGNAENSLLENNESTENLVLEKEGKVDQVRTLDFAHRRKWNALVCGLMIVITLPLFAFGGYALHLQHRAVGDDLTHWLQFQNVSQKLATIFPILFATVVGWCLKKLAQWKLERGSALEPLERLMGSQTVGSTIITQSKLGMFRISAVILVLIWTLSPLGSQSSLQIVHLHQRQDNFTNYTASYFDTSAKSGFATPNFNADVALNALFSTLLIGNPTADPTNPLLSTEDPFGNLIIPDVYRMIEFISVGNTTEFVVTRNSTGWYNTSSIYSVLGQFYSSSALGIPLDVDTDLLYTLLLDQPNATFTMETSFLSVNCSNNTYHTDGAFQAVTIDDDIFNSAANGSLENGTYYGIKSNTTFSLAINGFYHQDPFGSVWDFIDDTSTYEPRTLLFQSQTNATGGSEVTSAFCQLTTSYWESEVLCSVGISEACKVTSMRPSQLPHPNSNLTDLGFAGTFSSFSKSLAAASVVPSGTSSLFEMYVGAPGMAALAGIESMDMNGTDTIFISADLQQVLNAYFYGSSNPPSFMGGGFDSDPLPSVSSRKSPVVISTFTLVYRCDPAWLLVYFLASLVMLSAAIIGTVLNHLTNAPETLGYCSSIIKDNPHIRGSEAGSAMSGFSRTKMFRNLKLKLVDIEGENDQGYLAIVQDDGRYGQLPRKSARLYR